MIAQSTVYVWTDKSGNEHFTDDLNSVPRGVKVRTTEGAEISRIDTDAAKNPRPIVVTPTGPAVPSISEQTWRQLFRDAKNRVTGLEEDIEADRKQVEEVNGLPVLARFTCATGAFYSQPTSMVIAGQPFPGVAVTTTVTTGTTFISPASPCFYGFNPEYERIRERLNKNRRELVRAREDLADLERRASFEAVPLHWRR